MKKLEKIRSAVFFEDENSNQELINLLARRFFRKASECERDAVDFMNKLRKEIRTENAIGFCIKENDENCTVNYDLCIFNQKSNGKIMDIIFNDRKSFGTFEDSTKVV